MESFEGKATPDFAGDTCLVLPPNYLQSADAAAELYEDQLTRIAENLDVDGLHLSPFRHAGLQSLLGALVWLGSSPWVVCL
jgi:hypothetical protein